MFRGRLDWPVACYEIPHLISAPVQVTPGAAGAYQKVSTTSQKMGCLEGNVPRINDEGADDVADPIDLHEPSFVRFP
jgi:hypothetical protein